MLTAVDLALIIGAALLAAFVIRALAWRTLHLGIWTLGKTHEIASGSQVWNRTAPLLNRFRKRAPKLYAFLAARLNPTDFYGLPLTLLIVAACYMAGVLGGLVEEVIEADEVQDIDEAINTFLGVWRVQPLIAMFVWITALGSSPTLTAVSIIGTGFLWAHGRAQLILPLWVTFLGAQGTTWLGKFVIDRDRPDFIEAVSASYPSFPSGHATASMALFGFLAYVLARDLSHLRARFEIAYWAGVLVATIGFSRIFLSVHYTSDVIAGYMVGVFWLLVGFVLAEHGRDRSSRPRRVSSP